MKLRVAARQHTARFPSVEDKSRRGGFIGKGRYFEPFSLRRQFSDFIEGNFIRTDPAGYRMHVHRAVEVDESSGSRRLAVIYQEFHAPPGNLAPFAFQDPFFVIVQIHFSPLNCRHSGIRCGDYYTGISLKLHYPGTPFSCLPGR